MANPLKIAIAGLGTVGAGTVKLLAENADLLTRRCGRPLIVTAVSARDRRRERGIDLSRAVWFDDPTRMAAEAEVDAIVEVIGGADGVAKVVVETAIARKRDVVTANKALLALHGAALARAADEAGVSLAFEAAVAGGIPIVKALREGLAGNRITRVYGILNGTCNYILTTMRKSRREFGDVLAEAQKLGYAEVDPSFDIDGIDTAHKLAILTSLAFGCEVNYAGVHVEGIRHVSPLDIEYAAELGYRIKLLGSAKLTEHGVEQRVHPCMVPMDVPIAHVEGVLNAVVATGNFVQDSVFEGRGAGAGPTASSVVSDLIDIAKGRCLPAFGIAAKDLARLPVSPMEKHSGEYYVRLTVQDRPGVIADVAAALRDERISMAAMIQRGKSPDNIVPVVLMTHATEEAAMTRALARIGRLEAVVQPPRMIRIEAL